MIKLRYLIITTIFVLLGQNLYSQTEIQEPTQSTNAPYRLFRTSNIWTFIQFETATGKMQQIQFDIKNSNRGAVVLNSQNLANGKKNIFGRFTLYPTSNIYTFILLDTIDGKTWQVQWSFDKEARLIFPIN